MAFDQPGPLHGSRQVLREYLAVVTLPLIWLVPISREIALDNVEQWVGTYEILDNDPVVTDEIVSPCREVRLVGRQIHNANTVATMLAYGESGLLTLNP